MKKKQAKTLIGKLLQQLCKKTRQQKKNERSCKEALWMVEV
jgi:hypothetical protein